MIDTGIWRNIGERLWAVREHVAGEEMFLANYSDGLSDVNLPEMIETLPGERQDRLLPAVRPSFSLHLVDIAEREGRAHPRQPGRRSLDQRRLLHLPQGDLRLHARRRGAVVEPFQRLIEADQLMAFRHEGFWRSWTR